jgi:hypothetical protein
MTPENTEKLYQAFPHLYRGQNKSLQESSMHWGFQCDDGWFDLIWNLSHAIEEAARQEGLEPQNDAWPEATQVKQKFGTLRFHLQNYHEGIRALIREAGAAAGKICEVCGASSSSVVNSRRWVKTLCRDHAEEFLRETSVVNKNKTPVWKLPKD